MEDEYGRWLLASAAAWVAVQALWLLTCFAAIRGSMVTYLNGVILTSLSFLPLLTFIVVARLALGA